MDVLQEKHWENWSDIIGRGGKHGQLWVRKPLFASACLGLCFPEHHGCITVSRPRRFFPQDFQAVIQMPSEKPFKFSFTCVLHPTATTACCPFNLCSDIAMPCCWCLFDFYLGLPRLFKGFTQFPHHPFSLQSDLLNKLGREKVISLRSPSKLGGWDRWLQSVLF